MAKPWGTHAPDLEREPYVAELLVAAADRVSSLHERQDPLDRRVAALEAKPRRKAPAKAD